MALMGQGFMVIFMVFQYLAQPWKKEGEEKGSLFHTLLSHCGLLEEVAPCGTQELSPERPESYNIG